MIARMKKIDDDLDLALIRLDTEQLAQWLTKNARMPKNGFPGRPRPPTSANTPPAPWAASITTWP